MVFLHVCCFRLSEKRTSYNTFGWARAEVVGALINAVFLYALCFSISVQAIKRFLVIEKIENPKMILIVGGVGLLINLIGMLIFGDVGHGHSHDSHDEKFGHSHGDQGQSVPSGQQLNIQGVFLHVLADALGSVVVLISASVIWLTEWEYKDYLDPVLSLVIVLLICASTWPLLRESVFILLNSIPGHIDAEALKTGLISTIPAIRNVHELHIWQLVGRFVRRIVEHHKCVLCRRIIATGHVEVEPLEKGVLSSEYHHLVGEQIKGFLHNIGIHSSTVQIEYSDRGVCSLECPPSEVTGLKDPDCSLHTCCQPSNGTVGLLKDGSIEILSKL